MSDIVTKVNAAMKAGEWVSTDLITAVREIEQLRAKIKTLEDNLANASWQREYDEVMGRNGSGMDGGW